MLTSTVMVKMQCDLEEYLLSECSAMVLFRCPCIDIISMMYSKMTCYVKANLKEHVKSIFFVISLSAGETFHINTSSLILYIHMYHEHVHMYTCSCTCVANMYHTHVHVWLATSAIVSGDGDVMLTSSSSNGRLVNRSKTTSL